MKVDDSSSLPSPGDIIGLKVDACLRRKLSECHTAGHVVDAAMAKCGLCLPPTKGYHFLDGPYVEYRGTIVSSERADVLEKLSRTFTILLEEDIPTKIEMMSKIEADRKCNRLAQNFDFSDHPEETVRIVTVANFPCPCGGTHVRSTGELKGSRWGIKGIKCKKDVVRIKYDQL
mmetsp:Transcript_23846/g.36782  ORF Transcript_23846/g.36782 Transcript_23846/m.36782 type:complete len:174 (+) Transcript_23846:678-1199(+)|eukprot:CAMPEP_0196802718 /NCGR_PEP_ID=MMETSP1362-20130617/2288_1 /TAXON_ID=163516 /ORGANISM="Leptocylindrus danicus, Strain CCMP1856" /LENGTH=173 /DNA_ID=CAMNT_0042174091 /DNA_START=467 /DNA_END=988 /DNA_ORIENTATION=+